MSELFARAAVWPASFAWTLAALVLVSLALLAYAFVRYLLGYDHDGDIGGDR
jgi:hypothetical protein